MNRESRLKPARGETGTGSMAQPRKRGAVRHSPIFTPLPKPDVYWEFNHKRELVKVEKSDQVMRSIAAKELGL